MQLKPWVIYLGVNAAEPSGHSAGQLVSPLLGSDDFRWLTVTSTTVIL